MSRFATALIPSPLAKNSKILGHHHDARPLPFPDPRTVAGARPVRRASCDTDNRSRSWRWVGIAPSDYSAPWAPLRLAEPRARRVPEPEPPFRGPRGGYGSALLRDSAAWVTTHPRRFPRARGPPSIDTVGASTEGGGADTAACSPSRRRRCVARVWLLFSWGCCLPRSCWGPRGSRDPPGEPYGYDHSQPRSVQPVSDGRVARC